MSKKNQVQSDCEILEIDKKTYRGLQASLDNKQALYVASKEREYELLQQKNSAMENLKLVSIKCSELMIKNQRGKVDNVDFDKNRLEGEALDLHVKNKYDTSESKKDFENELVRILKGFKEMVIDKIKENSKPSSVR